MKNKVNFLNILNIIDKLKVKNFCSNLCKNEYFRLFIYGILSSLAFAPLYLFFIFFFSFYHLLKSVEKTDNLKSSFYVGWWFGFGYFIGNCYWYCNSLLIEPLKWGWLIPFAISIIPAYLSIYIGFTTLFTKITSKYLKNNFLIAVAFSFFWTIFEYLRSVVFTGFPWNLIGYCLAFSPILIQTVSIFGSYIFGFFLVILFSFYYVKNCKICYIFHLIILLFIVIFGFYRLNDKSPDENLKDFDFCEVRLVQPNIPQNEKIENNEEEIFNKLLNLSLKNSDGIDYIVWPEASLPYYLFLNDEYDEKLLLFLKEKLSGKTLIAGGIRVDFENEKFFNSIFVIKDEKIIDFYDKYHLVPFGEYIPFSNVFPFLNTITGMANISKSNARQKIIKLDNFPSFSPNICYESIFVDSVNKNADLIINITNDAWFGNSSGPYQHLVASQFRAVENSVPVIRVANSGITAFIDAKGKVIKKLKLNETGVLDLCE